MEMRRYRYGPLLWRSKGKPASGDRGRVYIERNRRRPGIYDLGIGSTVTGVPIDCFGGTRDRNFFNISHPNGEVLLGCG